MLEVNIWLFRIPCHALLFYFSVRWLGWQQHLLSLFGLSKHSRAAPTTSRIQTLTDLQITRTMCNSPKTPACTQRNTKLVKHCRSLVFSISKNLEPLKTLKVEIRKASSCFTHLRQCIRKGWLKIFTLVFIFHEWSIWKHGNNEVHPKRYLRPTVVRAWEFTVLLCHWISPPL